MSRKSKSYFLINATAMLSHFLKNTRKQFSKSPLFTFINLFGLSSAMAVAVIIMIFVHRELSYDKFHENSDDIYRVGIHVNMMGEELNEPITSAPMGPDLMETYAEVESFVRLSTHFESQLWQGDNYTTIKKSLYADSTFFDVFSFNLLSGNPSTVLTEPYSVVLTQSLAESLFPGENAVGKQIRIGNQQNQYIITGIAADSPPNSHIQFDILCSFITQMQQSRANFYEWDAHLSYYTYLKMAKGADIEALTEKTKELTYEKVNYKFEGIGVNLELNYMPISDIRLHSPYNHEMVETGTIGKVWMFSLIALFVLFIAGFNYVNLTIARSGQRAREIGIRKVLGAHRKILNTQFYVETLTMTLLSFGIALFLAELLLPVFNHFLNLNLALTGIPWWTFPVAFLFFTGLFGLLAGAYPAWYMGSFQPVKILRGEFWNKPGKFQPRNLLLLLQFVVSLGLIVSTLVIFLQIRFFLTKDYGYNPRNLIAVQAENLSDANLLRSSVAAFPWVVDQSIATTFPGGTTYMEGITPENTEPGFMAHRLWADQHYFSTMGINLNHGRLFSRHDGMEVNNVLINQSLLRKTGWDDPIGKTIERNGVIFTIIGVLNDYHIQSLHHEVEPLMLNALGNMPEQYDHPAWVLIRYQEDVSSAGVLLQIQETWQENLSGKPLQYHFVNELIRQEYETDRSFGRLFLALTILAIIIAILGIFGLSGFAAQQRLKEIGIRKILGATAGSLIFKMSVDFLKWILIAALIAFPLAWWFMTNWLAGFAYSVPFPWWSMVVALLGLLLVALVIIARQALIAINANPVNILKAE